MSDLFPSLHTKSASLQFYDCEDGDGDTPHTKNECPTCCSADAVEISGTDLVCFACGTLVDTPLEEGAEYRWFSYEFNTTDQSRCGFPVNHLMPESSLGTIILTNRRSAVMRRVANHHKWNRGPYREFTLWAIFDSLFVRATNAGIGSAFIEEAKELFAQVTARAICRGQAQRDGMLAACIWEALRRHGTPRMPRDIATIFAIDTKQITKSIKQFQHLFAIRTTGGQTDTYTSHVKEPAAIKEKSTEEDCEDKGKGEGEALSRANQRKAVWQASSLRITTYEDFVEPFLTNLSVPRKSYTDLCELVRHVCQQTDDLGVVPENTPPSLTASVIVLCCREMEIPVDLTEVSRVCGISVVTIQKCLKRMEAVKEKLFME